MLHKKVYFFVDNLNASFVESEVKDLCEYYAEVKVYSLEKMKNMNFKSNVTISVLNFDEYKTLLIVKKHFLNFLMIAVREFIAFPKYIIYIKKYNYQLSELLRSFYLADKIQSEIENENSEVVLFYTYWFNQWATALSILTMNGEINSFITRAHGTDMYEFRVPETKRLAFRWFQLKHVKKVFSVSETGMLYLKKMYPKFVNKIHCIYLGTKDYGIAEFDENLVFTIVSCAKIRNIKRIHLIAKALQYIDFPICWMHIGGENKNDKTVPLLYKELEALKKNKNNVEVIMKGEMNNIEIFDLYKSQSINLFISVSETEGLPVSMMEAISFGIPILSTDVGGCNEIVTEDTGLLISENSTPEEIAFYLKKFKESTKNKQAFHNKVRNSWEEKFKNENNFSRFISENV